MQLTLDWDTDTDAGDNEPENTTGASHRFDLGATDKAVKAHLRNGSNICQCAVSSCNAFFSGVKSFDKHLIGASGPNPRCRTPEQMRAIGMVANSNGVWLVGIGKEEAERLEHTR